jgi:hypothetical protein
MHQWSPMLLSCLVLMVGCTAPKPTPPPMPNLSQLRAMPRPAPIVTVNAVVAAPRLRGCAWDAPTNFNPLVEFFEVWTTTNLTQPFTLRTNTQSTVALFPEQSAEFYMVRTANSAGEKSDWATTGH